MNAKKQKPLLTSPKGRKPTLLFRLFWACVLICSLPFGEGWGGASYAQNNMGIGTLTPHASSLLDLAAKDKGLLIPRVTDTNNIISPDTALLIYLIPTNTFYYFNGNYWTPIIAGTGI